MNQLLEWAPLIVFFVAYKTLDLYRATAVLMITCVVVAFAHRITAGRFKTMHVVAAGVALVLGTATLALHDTRFIQWKPTVLLAVAAAAFLGSAAIGEQPLAQRLLVSVFPEPPAVSRQGWQTLNGAWACWLAMLALANIYIARNFTESVWVNFKVFGITAAMMVFMIPQVIWLNGRTKTADPERG